MVKSSEPDKQTPEKEIKKTPSKPSAPQTKRKPLLGLSLFISMIALLTAIWAITNMQMAQKALEQAQSLHDAKLLKLTENHSLNFTKYKLKRVKSSM